MISVIQNREKNRKIEKSNIFMENPKARNKKESKPKSNLNLSNKKNSIKSNVSFPNLKKNEGKRTGASSYDLMVTDI